MEAAKLSVIMRRELDWMVLTVPKKDLGKAYPSANELGADMQSSLGDVRLTAHHAA